MEFILSDFTKNSYGFKVLTSGIDTTDFTENPVMLYNHNMDNVIGQWDKLRLENDKLIAEPIFDVEDELACKIEKKVRKKLIKGCSIGIDVEDAQEINGELVVTKSKLYEASVTPLPSNKNAVVLSISGKKIDFKNLDELKVALSIKNKNLEMSEIKQDVQEIVETQEVVKTDDAVQDVVNTEEVVETQEVVIDELEVVKTQNVELSKKIEDLEKVITEMTAGKEVEILLSKNKIEESEKDTYIQLYKKDKNLFESITKNLVERKQVSLTNLISEKKNLNKSIDDRSNWTLLDWDKKDPAGLRLMYETDTEKYYELERKQEELNKNKFKNTKK